MKRSRSGTQCRASWLEAAETAKITLFSFAICLLGSDLTPMCVLELMEREVMLGYFKDRYLPPKMELSRGQK